MNDASPKKDQPAQGTDSKPKTRIRTGLRAGHEIVSPRDPASGLPTGK